MQWIGLLSRITPVCLQKTPHRITKLEKTHFLFRDWQRLDLHAGRETGLEFWCLEECAWLQQCKEKYRPHLHVKPEWRHRRRRRGRRCLSLACAPADSGTWCGPVDGMKRENYAEEHMVELLVFTCRAKLLHENATTVRIRRWPTTQKRGDVGKRDENSFLLFRITRQHRCGGCSCYSSHRKSLKYYIYKSKKKYANLNSLVQWTRSSSRVVDRQRWDLKAINCQL